MLILFKFLFFIIVLTAVMSVIRRGREGVLGKSGLLFWLLFWFAALIAVLYPGSTQFLAAYLGIGRGADLVFYSAIIALFYLMFRLHIKIEGIQRDVTKIVRQEALKTTIPAPSSSKKTV